MRIRKKRVNTKPRKENKEKIVNRFILKAKDKWGNKYDYSKIKYKSRDEKVTIICPIHGDFETTLNNHLIAQCKSCANSKSQDSFLIEARRIHSDKYDYSKVCYKHSQEKIEIVCKEHGSFLQLPTNHTAGIGCPKCSSRTPHSKNEKIIENILMNADIKYEREKTFVDCINPNTKKKLRFDFWLPDYNYCIEYDGKQHYEKVTFWGENKRLEEIKYRDEIKTKYCLDRNIQLLRIRYDENLIHKIKELISKLQEN